MLILNIFAVCSLVIFALLLLLRKNNSITNILLALIIVCPAINFTNNAFVQSGLVFKYPIIVFISAITEVFYAPLVLAYCRKMIGKEFKKLTILHCLTLSHCILAVIFYIQFLTFGNEQQFDYLRHMNQSIYPWQLNTLNTIFTLLQLIYTIKAVYEIYKYSKSTKQFYSNTENIKLSYMQSFATINCILTFVMMLCYITLPTRIVEYIAIPLISISIYLFVLYFAFHHAVVFQQTELNNFEQCLLPMKRYDEYSEPLCQEIKAIQENPGKYKLTEAEMEDYYCKILNYLDQNKPYLNTNISLQTLSDAIGACSHNVSLTINVKFGMNFFNLINSYRIRDAKLLLESKEELEVSIEQISYDVGFQTKSTFYNAFKTHTGTTPLNYLKQHQKSLQGIS